MSIRNRLSMSLNRDVRAVHRASPLPLSFENPLDSALVVLIDNIYFFPLNWRKYILDFCRIQASPTINSHLQQAAADLVPKELAVSYTYNGIDYVLSIDIETLNGYLDHIAYSAPGCTLLSYFVRAESTHHVREFLEQKTLSLEKEFQAATNSVSTSQVLDYSGLFFDTRRRLHPQLVGELPSRLVSLYNQGLHHIRSIFSRHLSPILLPSYNSNKNVSYSTQDRYFTYMGKERDRSSVTTLDLLYLYSRHGERITGPLEMRQAWFNNDLKPRTYYCLGGDMYWAGLYIQSIANAFAEILPSTHPYSRFNVSRIGPIPNDNILITYDYSSFTSNLSELKFFIHWLALECRNIPVEVYDPFAGVVTLDLGEVLREYNELANHYSAFTVNRFFERMEDVTFHMGQNGALGVKGNIVFSTTLHGAALADITGTPANDCVVGDDALTRIISLYIDLFIRCVNNLGSINHDKFSIVLPLEEDPIRQSAFKFLKRPLNLDGDGIPYLGVLDFFPDIATILRPAGDGIHSSRTTGTTCSIAKNFVKQVGRFYLNMFSSLDTYELTREEDLESILGVFRACYEKLGIPLEGALRNEVGVRDRLTGSVQELSAFVPPVDTIECFYTHWVDVLYSRFHGVYVRTPVLVGGDYPPPADVVVGERFYATTSCKELSLMEALGYVTKDVLEQTVEFSSSFADGLKREIETGSRKTLDKMLAEYTVVELCPFWFDLMSIYREDSTVQDPLDALTVVSSYIS